MSLRERMKIFENKGKPDRVLQRETVRQTERASIIRNKISLWGKSNNNNNLLKKSPNPISKKLKLINN